MGRWFFLQWPKEWENTDILKDMTYLEIIPIALAIYLWNAELFKRRVLFHVDNMAVVAILNKKTSKSARVLNILRRIVYWTLIGNCHITAVYIESSKNVLADALSRRQVQKFRQLSPQSDPFPTQVPLEFLRVF
jgi:hypothetical protein